MKVLLISVNIQQVNMRALPLGLACVTTAAQRAGHEVRLIDLTAPDRCHEALEQAIRNFQPDIIGISVRNIDDQARPATQFLLDEVKAVLKACRMLTEVPVVVGGAAKVSLRSTSPYVRSTRQPRCARPYVRSTSPCG